MDNISSQPDKEILRKTVKKLLAALTPKQFAAAGLAAAKQLPLIPGWEKFRSVLAFFSMKDEIDTEPIMETILKTEKFLFAPKIEEDMLVFYRIAQGNLENQVTTSINVHFGNGYREPEADPALILKPKDFPALVLTPGLAFDRSLNRLGRGRGFYDRFFASLDAAGKKYTALGLCMDCQLVSEVPACSYDKKMDALITESGIVF